MTPIEVREAVTLKIKYTWSELGTKLTVMVSEYFLPKDYEYTIENPYIDLPWQKHRYILRPRDEYTTVQLSSDSEIEIPCYDALEEYKGIVTIISVDDFEIDGEEVDIE